MVIGFHEMIEIFLDKVVKSPHLHPVFFQILSGILIHFPGKFPTKTLSPPVVAWSVQQNGVTVKVALVDCFRLTRLSDRKWVFQPSASQTHLELMFFWWFSTNWKAEIYWTVKLCVVSGGTFCWLEHRGEDFFIEIFLVHHYGGKFSRNWRRISWHCERSITEKFAKPFFKWSVIGGRENLKNQFIHTADGKS